ncbi:hypothetical protein [Phytomonospora endophytica]|uniref:Uncharacterized protein n=1 Tax=Phytomonospora endophytica TaxID=714109 RepID=A0A841G081_9ACTN|nr:hypothetical protein [Phytomonospora endophytica]MBB6039358.1 hypothetical protein [Phytomonospora endophytica]GIG69701.1 hypothetical protein Pen01_59960 [Phytomonospora endophytica]
MRRARTTGTKRAARYSITIAALIAAAAATGWLAPPVGEAPPADPNALAQQALDLEGRVYHAATTREHHCMEKQGFTAHPDDADLSDYILVPTLDEAAEHGFVNAEEEAATSGFTAKPVAYQDAYFTALAGDPDWDRASGAPPLPGTCLAQVNERLYGDRIAPSRPGAFDPANQEALFTEDPRLITAYDDWRACLRGKGDHPDFATVDQARKHAEGFYEDDDYTEARRKELALAVDVSVCASGSGLREAYRAARESARATLYERFRPQITTWCETLRTALDRADEDADA